MTSTEPNLLQRGADGLRIALGVGGLISVVLGLLILLYPGKSGAAAMSVIAVIIAAYALVVGVSYLGISIFSRTIGGWARTGHIVLGLLYVVGGAIMMLNLAAARELLTLFLVIVIGVLWLFEGVMAFTVVGQSSSKAWTVIYGAISVIAGLVLIFSPLLAAVTLWLLLGISMLVLGLVQVVRAFSIKPSELASAR